MSRLCRRFQEVKCCAGDGPRCLQKENARDQGDTCQQDVIVNGLGDADHRALNSPLLAALLDGIGCSIATVAPNDKQHVDAPQVQALHDGLDVRSSSRCALAPTACLCKGLGNRQLRDHGLDACLNAQVAMKLTLVYMSPPSSAQQQVNARSLKEFLDSCLEKYPVQELASARCSSINDYHGSIRLSKVLALGWGVAAHVVVHCSCRKQLRDGETRTIWVSVQETQARVWQ